MAIIYDFIDWASAVRYDDIPERILELAKSSIADTIGVACFGLRTEAVKRLESYLDSHPAQNVATCIGTGKRRSVLDAALWNGYAAHVDDLDEISLPGHTAVVMVPAALAAAEYVGASGKEMLRAYCLGVEFENKLAALMVDQLYGREWHSSPVLGTVGAAAIAALLLNLDREQFACALGIAASRSCGLMRNFGTMTKPYHMGMAAANGIECALMAKHGITAAADALDGEHGFINNFAGTKPEDMVFDWNTWTLEENAMVFKQYSCCVACYSPIAAALIARKKYSLKTADIDYILCEMAPSDVGCMKYTFPTNSLEAKFSVAFPVAWTLLHGAPGLTDFSDEHVRESEVVALMKKVRFQVAESLKFRYVHPQDPCFMTIQMCSGETYRETAYTNCSGPQCWDTMISAEDLRRKFFSCTAAVFSAEKAHKILNDVFTLENVESIAVWTQRAGI